MKNLFIILVILQLVTTIKAQDTLTDPYITIKNFTTFEEGIATTYTDGNNNKFGDYNLVKGEYNTTFNFGIFYKRTNIFNDPEFLFNIKTGLFFNNNYVNVSDSIGKIYTFNEINLTIPLMIGVRYPINYNRPQDRFFKAVNMNFGGFISLPMFPSLVEKGNAINKNDNITSDYIKFGLIAEIVFTALNKEGKGHTVGIRTITDLGSIITFDKQKYGIHPTYISLGLFYNFLTF